MAKEKDRRARRGIQCLVLGFGLSLASAGPLRAEGPVNHSGVIVLPKPTTVSVMAQEPAVLPVAATAPSAPAAGTLCPDGICPLYFRDRPRGCKKEKRAIMLNNRIGEPEWYRYYRCEHFGYHPTVWTPWPDNWLTCRPVPTKHPYDLTQPDPLPAEILEPDSASPRRPPRVRPPQNSTEPELQKPPERPADIDVPKPLPQ